MKFLRIVLILLSVISVTAQEDIPVLTEVQKLQLQNLAQQLELAQLKAQLAQRDFDAARDSITRLTQSLQIPGYTLNLQSFSYVKNPDPPKDK